MKIFFQKIIFDINLKAIVVATVIYFLLVRLFQDWLSHLLKWDLRPEGLFESFGPFFFQKEPLEIYLFFLAFLAVPLLAHVLRPLTDRLRMPRLRWLLIAIGAVFFLAAVFVLISTKIPFGFVAEYLAKNGVRHTIWFLLTKRAYISAATLVLSALFFLWFYFRADLKLKFLHSGRVEKFFAKLWPFFFVALAVFIFNPNYPTDPHHYNYFMGAINDIRLDKALLYDSSHLYGLLNVYFLAFLFKFLPFSYGVFSLMIMTAFFLFLVGIFWFSRRWLSSYTLATIGTASVFAVIYLFQTSPSRSALFFPNMSPLRFGLYIIPLFFIFKFNQTKEKKWIHLTFLFSGISIFWNFDSGIFAAISALIIFIYDGVIRKIGHRQIFHRFALLMAYIGGVFVSIQGLNYLVYGDWPDWHLFLRESEYFVQGAGMYPLPALGVYQVLFIAYLFVIVTAIQKLLRRESFNLPFLFLAVFGSFSFIYYIGESTWQVLYAVAVPFILISLFAVKYFYESKLVRAGFATILVFSALLLIFKLPVEFAYRDYASAQTQLTGVPSEDMVIYEDARYIKEHFPQPRIPLMARIDDDNDTKILIYAGKTNYFDFYYAFTIYFEAEMDRYIQQVKDERPQFLFIGRERSDQIEYFFAGIEDLYFKSKELRTLDVYELKP